MTENESQGVENEEVGNVKSPTYQEIVQDIEKSEDSNRIVPLPINTQVKEGAVGSLELIED